MELEGSTMADLRAASRQLGVVVKLRAADAESSKQRRLWRSKHAWLHGPTTPLLRTLAVICWGCQWTREHSNPGDCIRSLCDRPLRSLACFHAPSQVLRRSFLRNPRPQPQPRFETFGLVPHNTRLLTTTATAYEARGGRRRNTDMRCG